MRRPVALIGRTARLLGRILAIGVGSILIGISAVVVGGLLAGYRPVAITTDSMAPAAPTGSLLVAEPRSGIEIGDILVMRREGRSTITHRVVDLGDAGSGPYAITRGDANARADAAPYRLGSKELVARWVIPGLGRIVIGVGSPVGGVGVVALVVGLLVVVLLKRIWKSGPGSGNQERKPGPLVSSPRAVARSAAGSTLRSSRLFGRGAAATIMAWIVIGGGGMAMALYLQTETVTGNTFSAPDCYDAQLGSVQRGQLVNTATGPQTATITAIDPATSFLTFSVGSSGTDPGDASVRGRLVNGTTIEFTRQTDTSIPPSVTIDWSVVSYTCGVSVQRGVLSGTDADAIDLAITSVDPAASFVLLSSVAASTAADFDGDDLGIAELTASTNLRLRSMAPAVLPSTSAYAWQVVTFTNSSDVRVQTTTFNLGAATTATIPVTATDPDSTIVLATVASGSTGADIGERTVRAHLSSPTTVEVARLAGGDPLEVHLQVIELREGSTVQHGTLDLAVGQASGSVTLTPVDLSRATALGTVQLPGAVAGGATDYVADDIVGEASATFDLSSATTVDITRQSTNGAASFGWQVVSWGGPSWGSAGSPFRQRLDITAGSVSSPDGYTTPLTLDHGALVSSGLSLADGSDLRLLRWDGAAWTELDRVIDDDSTWNVVDTTLWFRTQESIGASAMISYWLYFGDPAPPAPLEDPAQVWLLTEGFESATLGQFEDRTTGTAWYRALPWTRRVPLTIPAAVVGADLTDQTVMVRLSTADLASEAQTDGSDIRFAAADGFTQLAHTIEAWDPIAGTLVAWVRLPFISSSTDTSLFVLYGAADAPDQSDGRSTWADDLAVWNLTRDPAGPAPHLDDQSPSNVDGLSGGAMTGADLVSVTSGWAIDLDGVDDRLDSQPLAVPGQPLTVTAWFSGDTWTADPVILAVGDPATTGLLELAIDTTTAPGTPRPLGRLRVDGATIEVTGGVVGTGGWHHIVATWDGLDLKLYLDGAPVGNTPGSGSIGAAATAITLGSDAGGTSFFDGRLGQVRILGSAWNADEVAFAESDLRSPTTTVVPGATEVGTWYDQGDWAVRRPLSVDAGLVPGSLVDYPLLVQTADSALAAGARSDGLDLVFTAADGITRLDHEIEAWDPGTGTLTAWVRLPTLDATTDTDLFLYYGAPGAADQQDPAGLWGPDAGLVAHLGG